MFFFVTSVCVWVFKRRGDSWNRVENNSFTTEMQTIYFVYSQVVIRRFHKSAINRNRHRCDHNCNSNWAYKTTSTLDLNHGVAICFYFCLKFIYASFFYIGWFSFIASGYAHSHLNCSILCVCVCVCVLSVCLWVFRFECLLVADERTIELGMIMSNDKRSFFKDRDSGYSVFFFLLSCFHTHVQNYSRYVHQRKEFSKVGFLSPSTVFLSSECVCLLCGVGGFSIWVFN